MLKGNHVDYCRFGLAIRPAYVTKSFKIKYIYEHRIPNFSIHASCSATRLLAVQVRSRFQKANPKASEDLYPLVKQSHADAAHAYCGLLEGNLCIRFNASVAS